METSIVVAIIGATVALFSVLVTALIGFLTWSRNIKYQILKDERERLEKKSDFLLEKYSDALINNVLNAKLVALIMYEFPKNVNEEFEKARKLGVFSTDEKLIKSEAMFNMTFEISKAIRDYNTQIQQTSEFIDKKFALKQFNEIIKTFPNIMKFV